MQEISMTTPDEKIYPYLMFQIVELETILHEIETGVSHGNTVRRMKRESYQLQRANEIYIAITNDIPTAKEKLAKLKEEINKIKYFANLKRKKERNKSMTINNFNQDMKKFEEFAIERAIDIPVSFAQDWAIGALKKYLLGI